MSISSWYLSDGEARRLSGYKARTPSPDRKLYAAAGRALPPRVDLRPYMTAIAHQGGTNSCVASAVAGACEYLIRRHRGEDGYDVSRLFVYYNARRRSSDVLEDEGATIEDAIEGVRDHGACSEATWPFDEDAVNRQPGPGAYEEAAGFRVEDVSVLPVDLDAWRACLADGYPIIFGLKLFRSFEEHRRAGLVPVPTSREQSRGTHAGHAMLCVGYSDRDQLFIVRNSWGPDWGDAGYCYIPYRYVINDRYNGGDTWVIRQLDELDEEGIWDDDSILEDVPTMLAAMEESAWAALLDALGEIPVETRLALVMLAVASADDLADVELEAIEHYLRGLLAALGIDRKTKRVLENARERLDDDGLIEESIALLGAHLPREALASLVGDLLVISDADEVSEAEDDLVYRCVVAWQLEGRSGE